MLTSLIENRIQEKMNRGKANVVVIVLQLLFVFIMMSPGSSFAQDGFPDMNFSDDGVTAPIVTGDDTGADSYGYDNGKILQLASFYKNNVTSGILLMMYNSDGTLDNTFGNGGIIRDSVLGAFALWGYELAVLPNGKILVSGGVFANSADYILLQYNADGSRDSNFGIDGVARGNFNTGTYAYGRGMAIQDDGKIIVTGHVDPDFGVMRFLPNGTLDNTFGIDGTVIIEGPGDNTDFSYAVDLLSNGKIIFSGAAGGSDIPVVVCLNTDGTLDPTFGTDGIAIITEYSGSVYSLAIQADDKILFSSRENIFRLNPNGSPDLSFGDQGVFSLSAPGNYDYVSLRAALIQPDGNILFGGYAGHESGYIDDLLLIRLNESGELDPNFGNNGIGEILHLAPEKTSLNTIRLQNDNKILLSGGLLYSNNTEQLFLARYNGTTVGIDQLKPVSSAVTLYPNPPTEFLNVASKGQNISKIEILNALGQVVLSAIPSSAECQFDIRHLQPGFYVVNTYLDGTTDVQTFVKN